ncbi:Tex-like N-terminal domain-containing protein [Bacillus sp. SL00103]
MATPSHLLPVTGKEQTGSLDEVQIQTISERYTYIQNVMNRKEEVIRLIAEQDKLTDELKTKN